MNKAKQIANKYGVALVASNEDASIATDRALPRADASALVAELTAAGIEASTARDHDDRGRDWVHVTEAR